MNDWPDSFLWLDMLFTWSERDSVYRSNFTAFTKCFILDNLEEFSYESDIVERSKEILFDKQMKSILN